ncbi:NAD(P)/FAD-dependent oxidoreductase [Candidatus Kaiserbacteria bacterium]|nr:NAD(P)/FAD-dependent oxidoreductase [Candidatus Kaiserbacteria bacterium]
MPMPKIVVIGGGHNGLVTAAYLAHEGYRVTILESRHIVGGAASTSTGTFHDFKISSASYLNSLFLPEIVRDLELERHGYEFLPRSPSSFTPLPDGKGSLLLGPDMELNQAQIAQFSEHDAKMYPRYERELGEIADWMAKMMTMIPPSGPLPRKWTDVKSMLVFAHHLLRLGLMPRRMYELYKLVCTEPVKYLDGWFESDILKATLLTDALIGSTKLSGYVLLHHVMGGAGGSRGAWGYMRGGMGGISKALAAAGRERGVEIALNEPVESILIGKSGVGCEDHTARTGRTHRTRRQGSRRRCMGYREGCGRG